MFVRHFHGSPEQTPANCWHCTVAVFVQFLFLGSLRLRNSFEVHAFILGLCVCLSLFVCFAQHPHCGA